MLGLVLTFRISREELLYGKNVMLRQVDILVLRIPRVHYARLSHMTETEGVTDLMSHHTFQTCLG